MFYVRRDNNGQIDAIFLHEQSDAKEKLDQDDPQILAYLAPGRDISSLTENEREDLLALEDLLEVLILKGILNLTDLPRAGKILARRKIREMLISY